MVAELKASRERMLVELPRYKQLTPRYRRAEETLFETIAAQTLMQAGIDFKPSEYHLSDPTSDAITDKQSRARDGVAYLAGRLLPFETEAGNRLSFALQLLQVPAVVRRISAGDELQSDINDLLPEAIFISRLIGELPTLRFVFYRLMTLSDGLKGTQPNPRIVKKFVQQMSILQTRLKVIHAEMGERLYPFDHARAETTLQAHALPVVPTEHDLPGLVDATEQMQTRLTTIQIRLFARLAQAAEKVEAAIGMEPLAEPDEDQHGEESS